MKEVSLLKFGDVFRYSEKEYVYLARTDDVFYTAQILDRQTSSDVFKQSQLRAHKNPVKNIVYCFVMLDTAEFRERMAHLHNTYGNDVNKYMEKYCSLNNKDLSSLKKEIMDEDTPVPKQLKELVKDIEIVD